MLKRYKLKDSPAIRVSVCGVRFVDGKGETADTGKQEILVSLKKVTEVKTKKKEEKDHVER